MVARRVNLLHVEDNRMQQRMVASLLKAMPEFDFAINVAESEAEALDAFSKGGIDFVLLDYQLAQGNGLHCLRKLRQRDPLVPIVALSATAPAEVAGDLIRGGADDYLNKFDLTLDRFVRTVREALYRTDQFRRHMPSTDSEATGQAGLQLAELCDDFLRGSGPALLKRLDEFESAARQAQLTPDILRCQFERVCAEWDALASGQPAAKRIIRPLMLELFLRLFSNDSPDDNGVA